MLDDSSPPVPHQMRDEIAIAMRRVRVYRMKADDGMTERQIAEVLGISRGRVHEDLKAAVKDVPEQDRRVIREIAHDRYEYLYRGLRRVLETDDELSAADRAAVSTSAANIVQRTVWLFGATLPQKVDVLVHHSDELDIELAEVVRAGQEDAIRAELEMRDSA